MEGERTLLVADGPTGSAYCPGALTFRFRLGPARPVRIESAMHLLAALETAVDLCLRTANGFVVIDHGDQFSQLEVDPDGNLILQTSLGELAAHAGFDEAVPDFPFLRTNRIPAGWHARSKIAAAALTRVLVEGAKMTFPTEIEVMVESGSYDQFLDPNELEIHTEAPELGFCFGHDRPVQTFIDEIAPVLGIKAQRIEEVHNALHQVLEARFGPLNLEEDWQYTDIVVELGTQGRPGEPWTVHR